MKRVSSAVVIISVILILVSCNKDVVKEYDGNYLFSTVVSNWNDTSTFDTTVIYQGSVRGTGDYLLKIVYGVDSFLVNFGTINPMVEEDGILKYREWVGVDGHRIFSGKFDNNGTLEIIFEEADYNYGNNTKITGIKQ